MHPIVEKILEKKKSIEPPYTYNDLNNACERLKFEGKNVNIPGFLIDYLLQISREFCITSEAHVFDLNSFPTAEQQLKVVIPLDVTALVLDPVLEKIFVELDKDSFLYMGTGDHFGSVWVSAKDEDGKKCIVKYQDPLMDYIELLFHEKDLS